MSAEKGNGLDATNDQPAKTQTKDITKFTARQTRVLSALMPGGWITRESVDRIAGASNGPQIIAEIRRKVTGYDGLDMVRDDVLDRDGKPSKPGRYRMNEIGRARVLDAGFTGVAA